MYQVIKASTGEIVAEALSYAPLEVEYAGLVGYYIRNTLTGVEWDIE